MTLESAMLADQDNRETQVGEHIAARDVAEARRLLVETVRTRPDDQRARMALFQLLCIEGAWDKARLQLRALGDLSPEARMLAAAYGQAIEGEDVRAAAFEMGEPAPLLIDAAPWAVDLVAALAAEGADAAALRAAALEACPDTPGEVDGRPFDLLFDGDDRFGPLLEAIVAGRWGMVPFAALEEISTQGPVDLRDMVWLPAELRFRDGPALAAMLPVRYPGTEREADADLRLARRTEWREEAGVSRGLGQRIWTTSDGDEVPILDFRRIRFTAPA
jgi:type VI secretion system protein ImpE